MFKIFCIRYVLCVCFSALRRKPVKRGKPTDVRMLMEQCYWMMEQARACVVLIQVVFQTMGSQNVPVLHMNPMQQQQCVRLVMTVFVLSPYLDATLVVESAFVVLLMKPVELK